MTGKELHDKLREELPDGTSCIGDCPFCTEQPEVASDEEEKVSDKVYDEETLQALLASARVTAAEEARVEADKQIAELEATIAEKDVSLEAAKARNEELEGEINEAAEAARLAELADERASQVTEVTEFSEKHVAERKAAWALMSEEEFAQVLVDFKAITETAKGSDGKPPKSTLDATRETAGDTGSDTERLRDTLGGFLAASGT